MLDESTNPIVDQWESKAYPGWTIRVYANGMSDATKGLALTPGFSNGVELLDYLAEVEG